MPAPATAFDAARALELAARTLDIEARALGEVKARLSTSFTRAVQAILASHGRVVVMGMGKSGHVGRKIAATLASTGTPAMFVHPAEASHGDLGMVTLHDVVLAISNSGEVDELTARRREVSDSEIAGRLRDFSEQFDVQPDCPAEDLTEATGNRAPCTVIRGL